MTKPTITKKDMEKTVYITLLDVLAGKNNIRKYTLYEAKKSLGKWSLNGFTKSKGKWSFEKGRDRMDMTFDISDATIRNHFNKIMDKWDAEGVIYETTLSNRNKVFKIIRGSSDGTRYLRDMMN